MLLPILRLLIDVTFSTPTFDCAHRGFERSLSGQRNSLLSQGGRYDLERNFNPSNSCMCMSEPQPHKPFESQGNETTFAANCSVSPEIIVQSTLITLQHRGFVDDQKDFS